MAADPGVKVHLYGKSARPGRKIGHVTALGDDVEDLRGRARRAASYLASGTEESWSGTEESWSGTEES
jgi:5-(carboxyamino)imidazole ribonucleotide synthase